MATAPGFASVCRAAMVAPGALHGQHLAATWQHRGQLMATGPGHGHRHRPDGRAEKTGTARSARDAPAVVWKVHW